MVENFRWEVTAFKTYAYITFTKLRSKNKKRVKLNRPWRSITV
jgi:hypothetical protein